MKSEVQQRKSHGSGELLEIVIDNVSENILNSLTHLCAYYLDRELKMYK